MFTKSAASLEWIPAGYEGSERAVLRMSPEEGRIQLVRLKKGAHAKRHRHQAPEDVYVISGKVVIGGHTLSAGDYLFTDKGEEHDLIALEDTVFYAATEKPVIVTEI